MFSKLELMIINEEKILKKTLNEELGILNDVRDWAYIIAKEVVSHFEIESFTYYSMNFQPFENETAFKIEFKFEHYNKLSNVPKEKEDYTGVTYFGDHIIYIYGYTINGKILQDKLSEVLQHELHHVFELHLSKKDRIINKNDFGIYSTSVKEAKNPIVGVDRNNIGYSVYLSFKFESNAFENGTYAYLMKQNLNFIGEEMESVKKSMYYKRFVKVKSAYEFMLNNPDKCDEIADKIYGKSGTWLKKTIYNSFKMCGRQIGRALAKIRNDYDYTHGGNNSITV